jgi:hypothetical protein
MRKAAADKEGKALFSGEKAPEAVAYSGGCAADAGSGSIRESFLVLFFRKEPLSS